MERLLILLKDWRVWVFVIASMIVTMVANDAACRAKSRQIVRTLAISYGHAEYVLPSNTSDEVKFRWLPPCVGNATPEPRVVFVSASLRSLLDAIRQVETGGHADPANAIGDGGASLGPYQISRAYWTDADVEGRYEHVKIARYAERVMITYWSRYCFDALIDGDFETLARVHNGGCYGHRKDATLDYWRRVSEIIAGDVGNLNESEAAR